PQRFHFLFQPGQIQLFLPQYLVNVLHKYLPGKPSINTIERTLASARNLSRICGHGDGQPRHSGKIMIMETVAIAKYFSIKAATRQVIALIGEEAAGKVAGTIFDELNS